MGKINGEVSELSDAEQEFELAEEANLSTRLTDEQTAVASATKSQETQANNQTNRRESEAAESSQQEPYQPSGVKQQQNGESGEHSTANVLARERSRRSLSQTIPGFYHENESISQLSWRPPAKKRKPTEFKVCPCLAVIWSYMGNIGSTYGSSLT